MARALLPKPADQQELFSSEDQALQNMICVATMSRDQANGIFRLGDPAAGETTLRLSKADGREFYRDPIYHEIRQTLDRFAEVLTGQPGASFENPFFDLGQGKDALLAPVPLTHPLCSCCMAKAASKGVVDEYGRAFDTSQDGGTAVYPGLYVTDASIIPTSLGINPTLTISAVALRCADRIVKEWFPVS